MAITGKRRVLIEGFDNYFIRENGEILMHSRYDEASEEFGILSSRIDRAGYITVRLKRNGKGYTRFLHRLLAESFLKNPDGKKFINHRNGVKTDNRLSNLEFCTHQENVKHAYQTGLIGSVGISKKVLDVETGRVYKSIKEASKYTGYNYATLKNLLNGNRKNYTKLKILGKPII
jgi:hypothetical protein